MIRVEQTTIEQAWLNWVHFHYGIDCEETTERFCEFVDHGDTNPTPIDPWCGGEDGTMVKIDIARRISLLAGPDFHTVIKVHYANNPWK